jgi:glucose-6-phosphate dehydrogenase assembly protein OpcA
MAAAINQSMKRSQSVDSFLSGRLAQVDVRKIEQELTRLWTKASDNSTGEEHPQVVRACSGNLILYTDRADAETTDANMLDEIVLSHPSRAILAISRESQDRKLAAWVTARCHLTSGAETKQVCSEQITVLAEGDVENELVSVIESLLLGDLPVFLWWSVPDLSGDKLGPFIGRARRLIVDSASAPYSFEYLRELHQLVDSTSGAINVSDLNWRRLLGIRSAIADEFERAPFCLSELKSLRKVKITSCGQELQDDSCSLQALLFVGWLASRLGWGPVSFAKDKEKVCLAQYIQGDQKIDIEFRSTVINNVAQGAIFEIEIEVDGDKKMRISRDPVGEARSLVLGVSEKGKQLREIIADDSDLDRVSLMGLELEEMGADRIFEESLESAFDLVHLLEAK